MHTLEIEYEISLLIFIRFYYIYFINRRAVFYVLDHKYGHV